MDFEDYQRRSARTLAPNSHLDHGRCILALGLAGEAGEAADYLKKVLGHGHPMDREKLAKELGDVLFYVAGLCTSYNLDMASVALLNVKKLEDRYPNGFDSAASQARKDVMGIKYRHDFSPTDANGTPVDSEDDLT